MLCAMLIFRAALGVAIQKIKTKSSNQVQTHFTPEAYPPHNMYTLFSQIVYKLHFTEDLPFQAVSIGAKLLIKSSSCLSWVRNGSSLSRRRAQGPWHLALSGSGCASRNRPDRK